MSRIAIHLNFDRQTEAAFNFYRSIFGGEFSGQLMRWKDIPTDPKQPSIPESDKDLIMHIVLPLLNCTLLYGSDTPESMRSNLIVGNNIQISLEPDTRQEADRLFKALSEGGQVRMPMQQMFWGDYYGAVTDKFGINWMIDSNQK